MLSGPELALALAIVLVGSTIMSLAGFGIGMVISPVLLLIADPQSVVMTINSLSIPVQALLIFRERRDLTPVRNGAPLAVAGLVGVPVGALVLSSASPDVLRITIAIVILALAIPSLFHIQRPLPMTGVMGPIVGFLGAMLVTGLGVGIPVVALYLVNQGWSGWAVRITIGFYYLVVAIGAVVVYAATGLFTLDKVWMVLSLVPAVLLGSLLASVLFKGINERALRYVILAVIVLSSLTLLGREAVGRLS